MKLPYAIGLSLAVISTGLIALQTKPARSASTDVSTPQASLRIEEKSWSPLGGDMAAVDFNMLLGRTISLRAVEVRVQVPVDPTLKLEISPESPSPDTYLLPVKEMGDAGVQVFAMVFPENPTIETGMTAIGTVRCDMLMEAGGPSLTATGLLADGSRIEIPIEYISTSGRQNQAPPVQRLSLSPNPTRGTVEFQYSVKSQGTIDLSVYDLSGRKVASVVSGLRNPGSHRIAWNTRDDSGREVAAGIYFVKLRTAVGITSERLSVVR